MKSQAAQLFTRVQLSSLRRTAIGSLGLKFAAGAFGLVNGVLLARLLGPQEFGVYSIAMAAVTLFATLATLGLPPLVTREVAIHRAHENWPLLKGLVMSGRRWVLLASLLIVSAGAALGLLNLLPATFSATGWAAVFILVPLVALNQFRAAILRGLDWVVTADTPDLLLRPLSLLAILLVVYAVNVPINAGTSLLIHFFAVSVAMAGGIWLLAGRMPGSVRPAKAQVTRRRWLKGSLVFLAIAIAGLLLEGQMPLYLLGYLAGPFEAGLYQATAQIVSVIVMGLVAIHLPLQSKLAAAWSQGDKEGFQRLVTEAARLGALLALASASVLMPFAEVALRVFGADYIVAADALRMLVLGQLINAVSGPCGIVLAAVGKQKLSLYGVFAGLVVSLVTTVLLAPEYGVRGAAAGTAAGLLTGNVLMVYWSWRFINVKTTALWIKVGG